MGDVVRPELASTQDVEARPAQRALAQQEVDPDHYDYPTAAKPAAMARSNQAAVHHHARSNANLASKQAKQSADIASNPDKPTSQRDPGRPLASGRQSTEANAAGSPSDRRLVYFASPSQLLVVQDNRMTEIDFITN